MAAAISGGAGGSGGAGQAKGDCTRELLKSNVDAFYGALAAHDMTKVPIDALAKYTENGQATPLGDGIWKTAGAVKFKRSALDTRLCTSVTESVMEEGGADRIYGVRLKLTSQKLTEIEAIIVRQGDYILNKPSGLSATASDDWETLLPVDQQTPRDKLESLMEVYFTRFPNGACNFASDCIRIEDGGSVGGCTGSGVTCAMSASGGGLKGRLYVLDLEAGISVGFTMFIGGYTDFHLFKVRSGEVHGVHAVLAKSADGKTSGWE
jgi:hypothetical protein